MTTKEIQNIKKNTIKQELSEYIIESIDDKVITNDNRDDWHYHLYNEDYYIVYHSVAIDWLKRHNLDAFEAIEIVKNYEEINFGEMNTKLNPESIVNMLTYIYGEELIYSEYFNTVEELKGSMEDIINN
jgi:hypothetical protein